MRAQPISDPSSPGRRRLCGGDHRHRDPGTPDRRYRQGSAGHRGAVDPARHRAVAPGERAARPCPVARFCPDARGGEMAEHRARHGRRHYRPVRGTARGPPHRASAGGHCGLDPRGGGRREERQHPRDRRRQRDRRYRAGGRSVPPDPGRCGRRARGGGEGARRAAAGGGKLPKTVRILGRRHLCDHAPRRVCSMPIRRWRG